jgi:hypothetical protein
MSEQKQSFMQELDLWTEANIIEQLVSDGDEAQEVTDEVIAQIKHAIREKFSKAIRMGCAPVRSEGSTAASGRAVGFKGRGRSSALFLCSPESRKDSAQCNVPSLNSFLAHPGEKRST